MRSLSIGVFAVAILLCATPLSLRSHGSGTSLSVAFDSADAAELNLPAARHRGHRHYAGRLYIPYCNGPYTGGGIGDYYGSTYYGGPWIDLRCYGGVY